MNTFDANNLWQRVSLIYHSVGETVLLASFFSLSLYSFLMVFVLCEDVLRKVLGVMCVCVGGVSREVQGVTVCV